MAELRRNSNTLPCNWLVPDLVITSTTAPELRPMSALYRLVWILNSRTASTAGRSTIESVRRSLSSMPS